MGLTAFSAHVQKLWERWLGGFELIPSPKVGLATVELAELNKIDSAAVDGLLGTSNSLGYLTDEIDTHLHSVGRFYGKDPGDGFLLENSHTPWVLTAGASEAFGAWMQLSDGDEISEPKYDPHLTTVYAVSNANTTYIVQYGVGDGTVPGTTVVGATWFRSSATLRGAPEEVQARRVNNTDKLWARCNCAADGETISIGMGMHPYPG